jgi:hypothetical protein
MGGMFLTIIIVVLTGHQRKMAEFLNRQTHQPPMPLEDPQLRREVAELRHMIAQQTIALDNLAAQQERLAASLKTDEALRDKLRQSG